jgi:Ca-activated chloride channel family protein
VFYILVLRRRKRDALRYANMQVVREAVTTASRLRRHIPPLLFLLGMAAAMLGVARPETRTAFLSWQNTVVLALDISRSMAATDVEPDRFTAAKDAIRNFIGRQPRSTRIGLVAFATTAVVVQQPTSDAQQIDDALDRLYLQNATAIGSAILVSLQTLFPEMDLDLQSTDARGLAQRGRRLESPAPSRASAKPVLPGSNTSAVIVLLSDGSTTTGPDPIEAAEVAAAHGVRVFTVGVGTEFGSITMGDGTVIRTRLDEDALKEVARVTKGQYFYAGNAPDLSQIYRDLSSRLSGNDQRVEISAVFAAIAAAFMLLAALLSASSVRL